MMENFPLRPTATRAYHNRPFGFRAPCPSHPTLLRAINLRPRLAPLCMPVGLPAGPPGPPTPFSHSSACLPACLPACLLACLPACLSACLLGLLAWPALLCHRRVISPEVHQPRAVSDLRARGRGRGTHTWAASRPIASGNTLATITLPPWCHPSDPLGVSFSRTGTPAASSPPRPPRLVRSAQYPFLALLARAKLPLCLHPPPSRDTRVNEITSCPAHRSRQITTLKPLYRLWLDAPRFAGYPRLKCLKLRQRGDGKAA